MKKKMSVTASQPALRRLSLKVSGQKVRQQNITAGIIAHPIKGMRRPFGLWLLSLLEAMNGSYIASKKRPDTWITDMIFTPKNKMSCGISGVKPALFGGR